MCAKISKINVDIKNINGSEDPLKHKAEGPSNYFYYMVILLLLCSYFHNDVPPEPQQNVSMDAVWGAITCLGHSNVVFIL